LNSYFKISNIHKYVVDFLGKIKIFWNSG